MPPNIDVYVQLRERDEAILALFLEEYMPDYRSPDRWLDDELPDAAIARALSDGAEAFVRYGRTDVAGANMIVLAFPPDGSLVLGLSVDGEDEEHGQATAVGLLDRLFDQFDAERGMAIWEEPPLSWAQAVAWEEERVCATRP